MRLTLRPEWRLRPLTSFLGFLDIKTGVTIALLFALLNKVAGVYGLVAVLTGAGGSLAQLSLYIYSVIGLVGIFLGLKAILHEDPKQTLYFAHLFFADHILSSAWLVFFAVVWWFYTPHDGRVQVNSDAQKEVMESGAGHNMTDTERAEAAMTIWNAEKGVATAMIVTGWIVKIYFAALLYSYAIHLRKGSYRSLPYTRAYPVNGTANGSVYSTSALPDEDDDVEEFYRLPVRAPASQTQPPQNGNARSGHTPTSSLSSFTDFVSAPGRSRRGKPGRSNLSVSVSAANGGVRADATGEVLFDEDLEAAGAVGAKDGKAEDRVPLMTTSGPSTSHSRRGSRSRD